MSRLLSKKINLKRALIMAAAIFYGVCGYFFYSNFANSVDYITTSYRGILIQEWIPIIQPILYFIAPALFVVLLSLFSRISWKKIALIAVGISLILTLPSYIYNLMRWQPILSVIEDLPIASIQYHRDTGAFPTRLPTMWIYFSIPNESYIETRQIIEGRLLQNKNQIQSYGLDRYDGSVNVEFKMLNQTPQHTTAGIYIEADLQSGN